jgi:hypothetical protein
VDWPGIHLGLLCWRLCVRVCGYSQPWVGVGAFCCWDFFVVGPRRTAAVHCVLGSAGHGSGVVFLPCMFACIRVHVCVAGLGIVERAECVRVHVCSGFFVYVD